MTHSTILTVQQISLLPAHNFATGIKGTIINLQQRISSRTGKPFYAGKISDSTGRIGVTFFRADVDGLDGREIILESDAEKGRGIRCDRHKHTGAPEISVFQSAHLTILEPGSEYSDEEPDAASAIEDRAKTKKPTTAVPPQTTPPTYLQNHIAKVVDCAQHNTGRVMSSLILASSHSITDPIKWARGNEFKELSEYLHKHFLHQAEKLERAFTPPT